MIEPQAMVLYGHCYEDPPMPYLPFVEAFRSLLESRPGVLEVLDPPDAAAIKRLLGKDPGKPAGAIAPTACPAR